MRAAPTLLSLLLLLLAAAAPAAAQQASVSGTVTDSVSGAPVIDVRVELMRGTAQVAETRTDEAGGFSFAPLGPGAYVLVLTRVDYRVRRVPNVVLAAGEAREISIVMVPIAYALNPVVVSASRTEQKALDAPASVSVIEPETIEERTELTSVDYVAGVAAVDYAQTGLTQQEVVVRGFNNVASGALLLLTDYRYGSVPSLRINVYNFIPLVNDDLARMEVVRGPGSALWGPNSANGAYHLVSYRPMDAPGTVVGLTAGQRSLFQATMRHASRLGRSFGLKISGQYTRGRDWVYADSSEIRNRQDAIDGGADPDTLRIGARDDGVERVAGELQFEWRPSNRTSWITSAGANNALRNVDLTPLGAAQVDSWKYYYLQTRLSHGRLFTQAYVNVNNAGDTYLLRSGNTVVDRSLMLVGQVQHGTTVGRRTNLTYGLDLQSTIPRTDSTITGRYEDDDTINEAGAYLHGETVLHRQLDLVAALRVDYHNRVENLVVSPRAALVFRPADAHSMRFTYNRAFSTPTTNNLFLDLFADSLRVPAGAPPPFGGVTLPYAVRVEGVPETGFTFSRSCTGGLCMRSPFTPASVGEPTDYIPVDATLVWSSVVDSLANLGIDLSAIPAPTNADVSTVLQRLDISDGSYDPVSGEVTDIPSLKPTITNTLELGYRGVLGERFSLAADLYYTWKNDFISAEQVETPNAFYDLATLANYLADYLPADQALATAAVLAQLPVGTVVPEQALDPWDIMVTYRNFGKITLWGADLDLTAFLSRHFAVRGTYSWVSRNSFEVVNSVGQPDTIPLNAPANKGSLAVMFRDDRLGLNTEVRWRAVESFPVRSGVYAGEIDGYGVWDVALGYRLPWRYDLLLVLSARNVFDNMHQEFAGAPEIGRLVTLRLRAGF